MEIQLTDRQWARVQPLLAQFVPEAMGDGRTLLDAMLYQALTGSPYRNLVREDERWAAVEWVHTEWHQLGLLAWLSRVLKVRLDP